MVDYSVTRPLDLISVHHERLLLISTKVKIGIIISKVGMNELRTCSRVMMLRWLSKS